MKELPPFVGMAAFLYLRLVLELMVRMEPGLVWGLAICFKAITMFYPPLTMMRQTWRS